MLLGTKTHLRYQHQRDLLMVDELRCQWASSGLPYIFGVWGIISGWHTC